MNTKSRNQGLVLGGLLILFGVLALLENVTDFSIWVWVGVLVIGSLLVYAVYATDREEKWMMINDLFQWGTSVDAQQPVMGKLEMHLNMNPAMVN